MNSDGEQQSDVDPAGANTESEADDEVLEPGEPGVDALIEQEELARNGPPDPMAEQALRDSLVSLGFVAFDAGAADNAASGAMVSAERRRNFKRDVYVGVRDEEQNAEFLGRVVEGPFHSPHEVSGDSAISRTTLLYPERTRFRPTYYVYGTIEILGEIRDGDRVLPTPSRPRPYSEIYVFPQDRLVRMLGLEGGFNIGHLMGYEAVPVRADVESKGFLPRNVGVFGTIGSGKSNTTQVMVEEAVRAGWAVVVVDVEGEYVRMDEATTDVALARSLVADFGLEPAGVDELRVYVPSSGTSDAASPARFKVPVAEVQAEVLADIQELSEPQQRMLSTIVANALRQGRGSGGSGAPGRLGVLGGGSGQIRAYTLQTLIDGLDEDQQYPLLGRAIQGVERVTASALRAKLIHLGRSGMLDWNANSAVSELPVDDLLVGGRLSVLDVSETDDRSRNIAISYLLQALFDRVLQTDRGEAMPNGVPRPPVLVVIEEVHTFVSRASVMRMRAVLDQLQVISRRGRKRWMGLVLVSQQPGHVPDELFELANTRFIHQLKSATNLGPVRQTTGGVHEALWSTVPALGPGQCLLTGSIFRNPIFVNVRPAKSRRLLVG
jgi:DNA helicase HerA-like ATPase